MSNRFNHYVNAQVNAHSTVTPMPSVALCGYVWYPTGLNPRRRLCPECERRAFGQLD